VASSKSQARLRLATASNFQKTEITNNHVRRNESVARTLQGGAVSEPPFAKVGDLKSPLLEEFHFDIWA